MSENMANKLRDRLSGREWTSKVVGYVLLGAIGLVFVFFGYSTKMGGMGIGSVGRVNDTLLTMADFQNEENRIQQYYANLFGGQMDLSAQRNLLRQQAIETMIRGELVSQAARDAGIRATDAEVADFIMKDIPAFQDKGVFQKERYLGYLENSRTSAGDFENRIRKEIESIRARQVIEAGTRPIGLEAKKTAELQGKKLDVAFVRLSADDLAKTVKVTPAEVQAKLADKDFAKKAQDYFQAHKADWSTPETVKAQHILVGFKAGDKAGEEKALEKIKDIRAQATKGDFGALATKYSEDPGSKTKKGLLEPFGRGRMVKEFEDAAFGAKVGDITAPVKTPFGYHIIKVLDHQQGKDPSFDEVKNEVASRVIARDRAEDEFKALDDAVAKNDNDKVDAVVKSLGANWDETGPFDLAAEAVPKLPAGDVASAAFEVSEQKPLLGRVLHEGGARYVLRYKATKAEPAKASLAKNEQAADRQRADGVFSGWVNQYRENSKVEVNNEIFSR